MIEPSCPRLWEVEAARDGRLSGNALVAFEQHSASCIACGRERRLLDELARGLRQGHTDEVRVRRLRHATLERANASLRRPERRPDARAAVAILLAAAATVVAVEVSTTDRPKPPATAMEARVVASSSSTRWSSHFDAGVEHVVLSAGALRVEVRRSPRDGNLVVDVPDGVIEDVGTVFTVDVDGGRTTQIAVLEGAVVFHRRGGSDVRVSAGSFWRRPEDDAATPAPALARSTAERAAASPPPESRKSGLTDVPHGRTASVGEMPAAPAIEAAAGRREEDAAYLRIVALLREERREEARLAASDYLARFPDAFRRPEVERIARSSRERSAP